MTTRRRLAITLLSLLAGAGSSSAAHARDCATVEVRNVRAGQGSLMVAAYTDAASFGRKPVLSMRVPAADAVTTFQLCGLSNSAVALMLFQDLDDDGKMARNVLGLPIEPWGSSGTPGMFGPSWETGRVERSDAPIVVSMSL